jgi:hypothetical protein
MSVTQSLVELLKEALGAGKAPHNSKPQTAQAAPSDPNVGAQLISGQTAPSNPKDGADKISAMVERISQGRAPEEDAGHAGNANLIQAASNRPAPPEHQLKDPASKSLSYFYQSRRLQSSSSMIVSVPMLMMQLGLSVKQIVGLVQGILKECLRGDALKAMETAGKHLQDPEYVSGRIMANGADIASELSDAVLAYEKHDFRTFGQNLGKALRKVLLSQSVAAELPEGPPEALVLANVSAGMLRGFFGEGFAVDLESEQGYDPLHIDLHECVGRNIPFFQSMWAATMVFYGKKASQTQEPDVVKTDVRKKPGSWAGALALAMLQIPTALRRCGLGSEQKEMLMNAIKTLGAGMHHHVDMPSAESVSKKDIATEMAKTVKEWAHHDWYTFGFDLGRLLQDMFVTVYSMKYSVDGTGTLRKHLIVEAASARSPMLQGSVGKLLNALPAVPLAAVPLAVVALTVKAWRVLTRHLKISADETSPSRGEDPEALE